MTHIQIKTNLGFKSIPSKFSGNNGKDDLPKEDNNNYNSNKSKSAKRQRYSKPGINPTKYYSNVSAKETYTDEALKCSRFWLALFWF